MAAPEESPTARVNALRCPPGSSTIVLVLSGPILRADVAGLCERVQSVLESSHADRAVCEVGGVVAPDVVTVEALCRLQLIARRVGLEIRFLHAHGALRDLFALTGLSEVVSLCEELPVESGGHAEEREERRRVQEKGDPGDAAV